LYAKSFIIKLKFDLMPALPSKYVQAIALEERISSVNGSATV